MKNMSGNDLTIKWIAQNVAVDQLKPFEKNPRKISTQDFENLKRSLKEDGYHQRILCTPDLRVIGGHQRIKALKELGYGSTLIACEKTGRVCYGMELSPQYVDVIINRWQNFTGLKAVREERAAA